MSIVQMNLMLTEVTHTAASSLLLKCIILGYLPTLVYGLCFPQILKYLSADPKNGSVQPQFLLF